MIAAVIVTLAVIASVAVGGTVFAKHRATQHQTVAEHARTATCLTQLQSYWDALSVIEATMNTGANQQDYSNLVAQASVESSKVDDAAVTRNHCANRKALDTALADYAAVNIYWNDCITSYYCTPSESKMSKVWQHASKILTATKSRLGSSSAASGLPADMSPDSLLA
jgi:IS1 family transposase